MQVSGKEEVKAGSKKQVRQAMSLYVTIKGPNPLCKLVHNNA